MRVPVAIEDDHCVGCCEIDPDSSGLQLTPHSSHTNCSESDIILARVLLKLSREWCLRAKKKDESIRTLFGVAIDGLLPAMRVRVRVRVL